MGASAAMARTSTRVRCASFDEMPRALAVIVAAFVSDPVARFAWPSAERYLQSMQSAVKEFAGASFAHGTADVAEDFSGTALWLPPGVEADGEAVEKVFRSTAEPGHLDDALKTFEKMGQSHPPEPHWYLPLIGVDPRAQGNGVGSDLMRHGLARVDERKGLAYLETGNPRNIPLYERFGFEVMGEIQVGAAPVVTPMLRRPRRA